MKKVLLAVLAVLLINGLNPEATQKHVGSLTFDVRDKREVITRSIDKYLLLRVERADKLAQEPVGWDVQVSTKAVRCKFGKSSVPQQRMAWSLPVTS
jgi:hypothetical protein